MRNGSEKYQKFETQALPWVVTSVSVGTSVAFAVALSASTPDAAKAVLDFAAKLLGPMGAAAIAWAGVHHTIRNTRRQDELKVLGSRSVFVQQPRGSSNRCSYLRFNRWFALPGRTATVPH